MPHHLSSALTEKMEILSLVKDEETGDYTWTVSRKCWASVTLHERKNMFSVTGVAVQAATLLVRFNTKITLQNALRWGDVFLHLTTIEQDRTQGCQRIRAGLCRPDILTAKPRARSGRDALNRPITVQRAAFSFPGILTEKYYRNEADDVFRTTTQQRVLVTPKAIVLRAGDGVQQADGRQYTVRQVLDLDTWKNEYVIERQEDD